MKTNRKRVRLVFVPSFQGFIEGYVVNFLRSNFWRVSSSYEYEDVMQEAKLVFCRLIHQYPTVESPKHFMSLFKTSWSNRFADLSTSATKVRNLVLENQIESEEGSVLSFDSVGDLDSEGYVHIMIQQAPTEVRQVLSLFVNAPVELLEMATDAWKRQGKYSPDGNAMVNRMLGRPSDTDSLGAVRKYFTDIPV